MPNSLESTFEHQPEPVHQPEFSRLDSEKTVIRQDELLDAPSLATGKVEPVSLSGYRQSASQLLGQKLDHFLIESLVGSGGMGAVFRGRDLKLDREVAIKVVPIADRDDEAMRRFRVEAQSAAKLDHPNIARVYYVGETQHWSYIVFEFVEGTNLRELVFKKGVLPIDDAVCLTRQVAEALQHAYERKVVHRDIKPSNILVTQAGQAKLVDMGLARTTELDTSTNDLTASGVTLGTFDYISPEQAHDPRKADVRSDIYSLGCTLYFLLTGQAPFPEGTALQKLLMHGTKMPEDPRMFRSDISDSMIAILRKMMAKKPSDRYREPADLIHDLRSLAELEGLVRAKSSDNIVNLPTAAQRTWLAATLPLLVSFSVILGTTLWMHSSSYLSATFTIPRPLVEFPEIAVSPVVSDAHKKIDFKIAISGATENSVAPSNNNPAFSPMLQPTPVDLPSKFSKSPVEEPTDLGTIIVDPHAANDSDKGRLLVRSLEQAMELANDQPQINRIIIKPSVISTSLASLMSTISINSKLTIQSDFGQRCQWNIDGFESPTDPVSALAWFECASNQLIFQDIDVFWRASSMSRRHSLFSVCSNSSLQFKNCSITVQHDLNSLSTNSVDSSVPLNRAALPSIIVIDSALQDGFGDVSLSNVAKLPASVSGHQLSVRGQCDWVRMPIPIRTEIQLENSWLAIAGSMFEMNGSRNAMRTGVPLRIVLRNVTSYTQRPWMRSNLNNSQPYPIPFVRRAWECVFAGSKSLIEWNAVECDDWEIWEQSDEGNELSKWIDLRGEDNVYDAMTLSDYLTVKLSNGSVEQIGLGTDENLVSEERGLDTEVSWKKRPVLEPSRIHETTIETFEILEWNRNSFRPGFHSQ